jgi:site-specific DNA-adenine methylase
MYQKHRFNIFPAMSAEEFAILKEEIATNGYDAERPIVLYQNQIIDGANRYAVCTELGVEPAYKHFQGDDTDAAMYVLSTNKRRNLEKGQLAAIIVSNDEIVKLVKERVERERREKIAQAQTIANSNSEKQTSEKIRSSAQESKPQKTSEILADMVGTNSRYVEDVTKLKTQAPEKFEQVKSGEKTITEVKKEIKQEAKHEERARLAEEGAKKSIEIDFRLGDFEEVFTDVPDGSIDCIITDPPYPKEFIECWTKLARFAKRVLKPHGFCIAYSGQMHLPEVMRRMSEHLDYYWTFAVYHEGQTQIVNGVNLICRWKPVLVFQNGKKKLDTPFEDYFISEQREKNAHEWQQSKSGVAYLVERFTKHGDTIFEPFAGSGTTLIVAKNKGRKVLGAEINEETYNIAKALL